MAVNVFFFKNTTLLIFLKDKNYPKLIFIIKKKEEKIEEKAKSTEKMKRSSFWFSLQQL